ncbi:MAG: 1-acyl-sn-glycerol-3-phosphate acyltransferase [Candidatus Nomurabacteria bacterium]|nr:MAG: 1-acyl-sn-glycerol-3-phosphate acyltransferase [Candidatus Nomurabacteria bacterium]
MHYPVARKTLFPLIRLGIKSVEGIEFVPKDQPFLVAANHVGLLDPLFVGAPIVEASGRLIRFLVDPHKKYWRYFGRYSQWWTHAIPTPTREDDHDAWFRHVESYLQRGDCIGIFPEGEVSHAQHLLQPKLGLLRIAQDTGVPILPIGIRRMHPLAHAFIGSESVRLRIGKPILIPRETDPRSYPAQADAIMEELSRLSGIPYPPEQHYG